MPICNDPQTTDQPHMDSVRISASISGIMCDTALDMHSVETSNSNSAIPRITRLLYARLPIIVQLNQAD